MSPSPRFPLAIPRDGELLSEASCRWDAGFGISFTYREVIFPSSEDFHTMKQGNIGELLLSDDTNFSFFGWMSGFSVSSAFCVLQRRLNEPCHGGEEDERLSGGARMKRNEMSMKPNWSEMGSRFNVRFVYAEFSTWLQQRRLTEAICCADDFQEHKSQLAPKLDPFW